MQSLKDKMKGGIVSGLIVGGIFYALEKYDEKQKDIHQKKQLELKEREEIDRLSRSLLNSILLADKKVSPAAPPESASVVERLEFIREFQEKNHPKEFAVLSQQLVPVDDSSAHPVLLNAIGIYRKIEQQVHKDFLALYQRNLFLELSSDEFVKSELEAERTGVFASRVEAKFPASVLLYSTYVSSDRVAANLSATFISGIVTEIDPGEQMKVSYPVVSLRAIAASPDRKRGSFKLTDQSIGYFIPKYEDLEALKLEGVDIDTKEPIRDGMLKRQ